MLERSRLWTFVGNGLLAVVGSTSPSWAQAELPEIVITAPSPIVHPRVAPAAVVVTPQPGTLPVVTGAFAPVTVVGIDEIGRTPAGTLGDLLLAKPGISASTFAPGAASRPIIRGLDNFRVRLQENGVGSQDVSDLGEDHGVPIDPLAAERIEVIRGPATLRFGSQAIGGVVDVANNRVPTDTTPPGVSAVIKSAVTSVDNGLEGAVLVDARGEHVAVHADAYGRRAGDYAVPGGRQSNSAHTTAGQSVGASYLFHGGFAGFALSHVASLYHVPGTESAASRTRIDLDQIKLTGRGEYRPDSPAVAAIRYWLGATDYRHDEIAVDGATGVDGVRATFMNREQEARVEWQLAPFATRFGEFATAFGTQVGHQQLGTAGEAGTMLAPSRSVTIAGYVFNELSLTDALRLQAAGRIERARVDGTGARFPSLVFTGNPADDPVEFDVTRTFMPMSVSGGALLDLPFGVVASLTAQYVERAPKAAELFSKGAHDASGTFEIGDPNLTKEAGRTVEVGLRRAKGAWRFDATAYHTRFSNFIYKRLTGNSCGDDFATCGVDTELVQVAYSQRDATFTGAEFATQVDLLPLAGGTFGIDAQYDIVRATFADGTNVPRIPPQRVGGGVFWRDDAWFARVNLLHAFAQSDVGSGETSTAGYDRLKAELSHTRRLKPVDFGPREVTFGVAGDNLLDADIRNHASFRKDEVLLPGRSVRLFGIVRF